VVEINSLGELAHGDLRSGLKTRNKINQLCRYYAVYEMAPASAKSTP